MANRLALCTMMTLLVTACSSGAVLRRGGLQVHTFVHDSTNAHLVARDGNLVLIDSGYAENADDLAQDIRAAGFDPASLKAVILTHGHADHAGGARYFQEHFRVPVYAGAGDARMLAAGKNEPLCPTGLLGHLRKPLDKRGHYQSTVADTQVSDSMSLRELAGMDGKIVPLAGHTRGSLAVVIEDVAFVGDLFRGALVGSGAATHLYMCDVADNKKDTQQLLETYAPNAKVFFVGHFGPVSRERVLDHVAEM
jgi:hydroxyacylglutathione hydrolase